MQNFIIKISVKLAKNGYANKEGLKSIVIELNDGVKRKSINTGQKVKPDQFLKGQVVNHENQDAINCILKGIVFRLYEIQAEMWRRGNTPTIEMLIDAYNNNGHSKAKFVEFGERFIGLSERDTKTKLSYKTLFNAIEQFRENVLIGDIDENFIDGFEKWMRMKGLAHNTIVGRLRNLKCIILEAVKRKIIVNNPFEFRKIDSMTNRKEFVNPKGIKHLEELQLSEKYDIIRDMFLFSCYTGLRFSDIKTMSSDMIKNNILTKEMRKGKLGKRFTVTIPLDTVFEGKSLNIIKKYGSVENFVSKMPCNATVNKKLKEILAKAKITGRVTFHTSRHSFGTNLLDMGVQLNTIQKLMGHQKSSTTEIYAITTDEAVVKDLKRTIRKVNKTKVNVFDGVDEENPDQLVQESQN